MMRGLLHELRNPLSSILTATTLLQDTAAPFAQETSSESQVLLSVIGKEATRLNQILTEFDQYIRTPPPQPTAFDLVELLEAVLSQLQESKTLPPDIRIGKELPESCPVWADEAQISTVLTNLFKNAVEAITARSKERKINLQLEIISTKSAKFCLGDSGKGFQQESCRRAFHPFYSTKTQGLGLGLSVAKANIEASAGEIWIENSAPDEEKSLTEVCFYLPLAAAKGNHS